MTTMEKCEQEAQRWLREHATVQYGVNGYIVQAEDVVKLLHSVVRPCADAIKEASHAEHLR